MNARTWFYSCLSGSVLLVACGGAAIPQDSLTAAQADVKGAEVGGAADNPKAALHLKLAKDQIEEAQKQIKDGDNESAARTLDLDAATAASIFHANILAAARPPAAAMILVLNGELETLDARDSTSAWSRGSAVAVCDG